MIILHSLKILEQLSEIEKRIKEIEEFMEKKGIKNEKEKILEVLLASRKLK